MAAKTKPLTMVPINSTRVRDLNGFPDGTYSINGNNSNIGSAEYNVGEREKSTVMLYTYINRHAGTPKQMHSSDLSLCVCVILGS